MATNFLPSTSLDAPSLKESLKAFLAGKPKLADYDFEGSNISALLDLLAAAGFQHAFFTNMVGNEMFMDTAMMRNSAVSHAKDLNYVPRSRVSATAIVRLSVVAADNPDTIFVPKYYPITTNYAGKTYTFTTNEAVTIRNNGGQLVSNPITVYEGTIIEEYFVVGEDSRYIIQSPNVDVSSIVVEVQESSLDTTKSTWNRAYDLFNLNPTSEVFFVQGASDNKYELLFGNDVTGKAVVASNIIKVTYRASNANEAKSARVFTASRAIDGYTSITAQVIQPAAGGAEREDVESIKFNAPRHFAVQNRAIIDEDYSTLISETFPQLQAVSVYGGEEAEQKLYGRVVIVTKPIDGEITPSTIKQQIVSFIKERVGMTTQPVIMDPIYVYLAINSTVYFDPTNTAFTPSDIETKVRQSISEYNRESLSDFNSDFRYSKFVALLDGTDPSITSNETAVRIVYRISPVPENPSSYNVTMNNALQRNGIISTLFKYVFQGTTYNAFIVDDGAGRLVVQTNASGTPTALNTNVGSVDYATGRIQLNDLTVDDYDGSWISLYMTTVNRDVIINRDKIIQIADSDVNISIQQTIY